MIYIPAYTSLEQQITALISAKWHCLLELLGSATFLYSSCPSPEQHPVRAAGNGLHAAKVLLLRELPSTANWLCNSWIPRDPKITSNQQGVKVSFGALTLLRQGSTAR